MKANRDACAAEGGDAPCRLRQNAVKPSTLPFTNNEKSSMVIPKLYQTVLLLIASNVFMTFAWYGHLRKRIPRYGS